MLEDTILNEEKIKEILKEKYFILVRKVKKINRGSANIYVINEDEYVLKEFQAEISKEDINKEIEVINYLRKKNFKVPEYIKTKDDKDSILYHNKIIILQRFIQGYTMEANAGNYEQVMESATYLGKLVNLLENFPSKLPVKKVGNWCSSAAIKKAIIRHKDLLVKAEKMGEERIIDDLKDKIVMLEGIDQTRLDVFNKLSLMNSHGDYSVMQFIYQNGKITAIIDFIKACKMPVVWEIIRSYNYIDKDAVTGKINTSHLCDYVKNVMKKVKLNDSDLKYMVRFYLIQLLESTYGYKQYLDDKKKIDLLQFGFYRTQLCRYLKENDKEITTELMNLNY